MEALGRILAAPRWSAEAGHSVLRGIDSYGFVGRSEQPKTNPLSGT